MKASGFIVFTTLVMLIAGCGTTTTDPANTVEAYLQAKVSSQRDTIRKLLCSTMESDLEREVMSFSGVEASIQSMECQREGNTDIVACSGKIVAVYNGENTEFPLGRYKIVEEDGQWKWCGEA